MKDKSRALERKLESEKECAICNAEYSSENGRCPRVLNCGQTYCHGCIESMLGDSNYSKQMREEKHLPCPECRRVTKIQEAAALNKNYTVLALLD